MSIGRKETIRNPTMEYLGCPGVTQTQRCPSNLMKDDVSGIRAANGGPNMMPPCVTGVEEVGTSKVFLEEELKEKVAWAIDLLGNKCR